MKKFFIFKEACFEQDLRVMVLTKAWFDFGVLPCWYWLSLKSGPVKYRKPAVIGDANGRT